MCLKIEFCLSLMCGIGAVTKVGFLWTADNTGLRRDVLFLDEPRGPKTAIQRPQRATFRTHFLRSTSPSLCTAFHANLVPLMNLNTNLIPTLPTLLSSPIFNTFVSCFYIIISDFRSFPRFSVSHLSHSLVSITSDRTGSATQTGARASNSSKHRRDTTLLGATTSGWW